MKDVLESLPFYNAIVKVKMTGNVIFEMLEHSVDALVCKKTCPITGRFLQFSGLTVRISFFIINLHIFLLSELMVIVSLFIR